MSKDTKVMVSTELSDFIAALPKEVKGPVRKAIQRWVKAGADMARQRAPVSKEARTIKGKRIEPGTVRRAIRGTVFRSGVAGVFGIYGKKWRMAAWYARFLEFGTKPHYTHKHGKRKLVKLALRAEGAGMHPGIPERPFIRPAAQTAGPAGAEGVIGAMNVAMDSAAAKAKSARLMELQPGITELNRRVAEMKRSGMNEDPTAEVNLNDL